MLTLDEIKERLLKLYDPDDILEALQITTEDLLDRFEDRVIYNLDAFNEELLEEVEDYDL